MKFTKIFKGYIYLLFIVNCFYENALFVSSVDAIRFMLLYQRYYIINQCSNMSRPEYKKKDVWWLDITEPITGTEDVDKTF